ncbi:hypothetical protein E2C01_052172 [Portunus trituberculatus]|uniref:Uncharacterized protein n=1 Tax=Portunus trituberculatus TaxID=210409 RepID=A0A5B7GLN0_PORTR|nr:hypothetical protein [Portunus trituberculatus]
MQTLPRSVMVVATEMESTHPEQLEAIITALQRLLRDDHQGHGILSVTTMQCSQGQPVLAGGGSVTQTTTPQPKHGSRCDPHVSGAFPLEPKVTPLYRCTSHSSCFTLF